jgi:hypothetical protein
MSGARPFLVSVVVKVTMFTFTSVWAYGRALWGKGQGLGRISVLMRPNQMVFDLFVSVFGLLAPDLLDA